MRPSHALVAIVLTVTACEKNAAPAPDAPEPAAASESAPPEPAAAADQVTNYTCADGSVVEARYPTTDTAEITYMGETVDLEIAVSASGARYVGAGWEWWTKGETEGTLSRLEPGEDIASAAGTICTAS